MKWIVNHPKMKHYEIDLDEIRKITEAPLMKATSIDMTDEIWNGVVNA